MSIDELRAFFWLFKLGLMSAAEYERRHAAAVASLIRDMDDAIIAGLAGQAGSK